MILSQVLYFYRHQKRLPLAQNGSQHPKLTPRAIIPGHAKSNPRGQNGKPAAPMVTEKVIFIIVTKQY